MVAVCERVLVLLRELGCFTVRATTGDPHLGGENFNTLLMDYCVGEFPVNITGNKRAMCNLRGSCEDAKIHLSKEMLAEVEIEYGGEFLTCSVFRSKFESLISPLLAKCMVELEGALKIAKLDKSQVLKTPGIHSFFCSFPNLYTRS